MEILIDPPSTVITVMVIKNWSMGTPSCSRFWWIMMSCWFAKKGNVFTYSHQIQGFEIAQMISNVDRCVFVPFHCLDSIPALNGPGPLEEAMFAASALFVWYHAREETFAGTGLNMRRNGNVQGSGKAIAEKIPWLTIRHNWTKEQSNWISNLTMRRRVHSICEVRRVCS